MSIITEEPSRIQYENSLMQLSCSRQVTEERQYLTGYTGLKFKKREMDFESRTLTPALGFTGWYRGRVNGKLGTVDLHHGSIGVVEEERPDQRLEMKKYRMKALERDDSFNINQQKMMSYDLARKASTGRGHEVDHICELIKHKIGLKHSADMKRHLYVRNAFAIYDSHGTGLCTVAHFGLALANLGIVVPSIEFNALCAAFDEQVSGEISWMKFMERIGADHPSRKYK